MTIAMVTGTLTRPPERKTSKAGKAYTVAHIKADAGKGGSEFWKLMAFSATVSDMLLGLTHGDAVTATGRLAAEIFTGDDGVARMSLSLMAENVLTIAGETKGTRKAAPVNSQHHEPQAEPRPEPQRHAMDRYGAHHAGDADLDGDIPF